MLTCESCGADTHKVVVRHQQLVCGTCAYGHDRANRSAAVIDDTIIGGFVQEHFGHQPETFYSWSAMRKRAKELGLEPFVRHKDGDKHTSRWV